MERVNQSILRAGGLAATGLALVALTSIESTPVHSAPTLPNNSVNNGEAFLDLDSTPINNLITGSFDLGSPQIDFPGQPCEIGIEFTELKNANRTGKLVGRQIRITPLSNPENAKTIISADTPVSEDLLGQRNTKKWVNVKKDGKVVKGYYDATIIRLELVDAQPDEKSVLGEASVACKPCHDKEIWAGVDKQDVPPTATPTQPPTPTTAPTFPPQRPPVQLPGTGDGSSRPQPSIKISFSYPEGLDISKFALKGF